MRKPGEENEIVAELQLAHFSVQEYLVSKRIAEPFCGYFGQSRAEGEIVRVSLAYLFTAARRSNVDKSSIGLPFLGFCARNWMTHAFAAETEDEITEIWTSKMFSTSDVYAYRLRLFDPDRPWLHSPNLSNPLPAPLYYASLGGLVKSVRLLLDRGAEVKVQGGEYGNALQAASSKGHVGVVVLLLNKGAEVNVQGGHYETRRSHI